MTRLAVIGLGYWGPNIVRNFYAHLGEDLRIVCDSCADRVEAICKTFPTVHGSQCAEDVLANPGIDAVAIATPVATHYPLAKAALEAGKSVFIEKPLASSVAEAEELVDLAKRKGLILSVDHVFVHNNAVKKMKELLDDGQLGQLHYIDSVRINLGRIQSDVNVVWDLAPHDLSIVDYLVGRLPLSVGAFGATHTEQGLEDVAYINLDYGNGIIANFHVNWLSPVKIRYTIVGGSDRSIVFNDLHPAEIVKVFDSGVIVQRDDLNDRRRLLVDYRTGDTWAPYIPHVEPLKNITGEFLDRIENGSGSLTDGEAGLRVVKLLEAIDKSIRDNGARVTLAQPDSTATATPAVPVDSISATASTPGQPS